MAENGVDSSDSDSLDDLLLETIDPADLHIQFSDLDDLFTGKVVVLTTLHVCSALL